MTPSERDRIWAEAVRQMIADALAKSAPRPTVILERAPTPQTAEMDRALRSPFFGLAIDIACAEMTAELHSILDERAAL